MPDKAALVIYRFIEVFGHSKSLIYTSLCDDYNNFVVCLENLLVYRAIFPNLKGGKVLGPLPKFEKKPCNDFGPKKISNRKHQNALISLSSYHLLLFGSHECRQICRDIIHKCEKLDVIYIYY